MCRVTVLRTDTGDKVRDADILTKGLAALGALGMGRAVPSPIKEGQDGIGSEEAINNTAGEGLAH